MSIVKIELAYVTGWLYAAIERKLGDLGEASSGAPDMACNTSTRIRSLRSHNAKLGVILRTNIKIFIDRKWTPPFRKGYQVKRSGLGQWLKESFFILSYRDRTGIRSLKGNITISKVNITNITLTSGTLFPIFWDRSRMTLRTLAWKPKRTVATANK